MHRKPYHPAKSGSQPERVYDTAPFPSLLPRRISENKMHDLGLDEIAAKIPEGQIIMIQGTKKP